MSEITADLVAELARTWHGIELGADEAEGIAAFIRPMRAAVQRAAADLAFEAEPADFEALLRELAS